MGRFRKESSRHHERRHRCRRRSENDPGRRSKADPLRTRGAAARGSMGRRRRARPQARRHGAPGGSPEDGRDLRLASRTACRRPGASGSRSGWRAHGRWAGRTVIGSPASRNADRGTVLLEVWDEADAAVPWGAATDIHGRALSPWTGPTDHGCASRRAHRTQAGAPATARRFTGPVGPTRRLGARRRGPRGPP